MTNSDNFKGIHQTVLLLSAMSHAIVSQAMQPEAWTEFAIKAGWPITRKIQTPCDKKANDKKWLGNHWYAQ